MAQSGSLVGVKRADVQRLETAAVAVMGEHDEETTGSVSLDELLNASVVVAESLRQSPASIAGVGEAGAEKRSAPNGAGKTHVEALRRVADEAGAEYERMVKALGRLTKECRALRETGVALAGVLDLQRRRIVTLEAVGRIARAALGLAVERFVDAGWSHSLGVLAPCEEALRELAATLPDERDGVEASLANQTATKVVDTGTGPYVAQTGVERMPLPTFDVARRLMNPELMVQLEGEGVPTYTTLRAFIDANLDDEETCSLVRSLKPGESVNLGGGAGPMFTVTRKAA